MKIEEVIKSNLLMSELVFSKYLEELSATDLYQQASVKSNSLAWQLGHLIVSEHEALSLMGARPTALPPGFIEGHQPEQSPIPPKCWSMAQYLELFKTVREATHNFLKSLSEADLSRPAPIKMQAYAATVADLILAQASHLFMHLGQIAVLRRELNKKIVL